MKLITITLRSMLYGTDGRTFIGNFIEIYQSLTMIYYFINYVLHTYILEELREKSLVDRQ